MSRSTIVIIPSQEVDAERWDNCVKSTSANRIYARHIYLQHLADNWSGLVVNDYAAVMPIIWRRKWGIRYAYNAPFIQQLGLFGTYNNDTFRQATDTALHHIKYGDLYFNHTNAVQSVLPAAKCAVNCIIALQPGISVIRQGYNTHMKKALKKAAVQSLQFLEYNNVEEAIHTYQLLYAHRFPSVTPAHYQKFCALSNQLLKQAQCFVRKVVDGENNLLAIALFFKDQQRIYNILPSTTATGRKAAAMHFLIDQVLEEFAGTSLLFDFEGSDVPGIKAFYQSFGAVDEPYFHLHFNHLPIPLRWLKH